jgi:hypothetical protein
MIDYNRRRLAYALQAIVLMDNEMITDTDPCAIDERLPLRNDPQFILENDLLAHFEPKHLTGIRRNPYSVCGKPAMNCREN